MQLAKYARVFALVKLCTLFFYLGYRNAVNESNGSKVASSTSGSPGLNSTSFEFKPECTTPTEMATSLKQQIEDRVESELSERRRNKAPVHQDNNRGPPAWNSDLLFPHQTVEYAVGAIIVSKDDLMDSFDLFGVPRKKTTGNEDAIMIYNTEKALPAAESLRKIAKEGTDGVIGEAGSISDAVGQCDSLNVMMLPVIPNDATCTVVIGNFESYQINKWMRLPKFEGRKIKDRLLNHSLPLIHHPRVTMSKGIDEFDLPDLYSNFKKKQKGFLLQHLDALHTWLDNLDGILNELKELLAKRGVVRNNTVIVMTVNSGQSDLLGNFICQARSKGFDIGNVQVFSTDEETHKLVQGLGVASYYDHKNLGDMPKGEAKVYGDPVFARMMLAKVYCVLYVALLGHDVLFSDVDVVWLKNPLDFFHDKSNTEIQKYDILAQHDGSAQPRYNPLSANSGFYYVRANKKSQYLFTSLIYDGALVRKTKSHQQVLVQLLLEHQSMFGLKVKVFDKLLTKEFPGGFHYHQDWKTMRQLLSGNSPAYIFHMSWTENKVNKLKFLQQLGFWHLNDVCMDEQGQKLLEGDILDGSLSERCCSKEAIVTCHFSDKPSSEKCKDSGAPNIDNRGKVFW